MPTRVFVAKRGRVVFSVIGLPFMALGGALMYSEGMGAYPNPSEFWAAAVIFAAGLFTVLAGWSMKIVTDDRGISSRILVWVKYASWEELERSVIYRIVDPVYPLGIKLYCRGERFARITIRLKNYSEADVAWMLRELPLKISDKRRQSARGEMDEPNASGWWRWIIAILVLLVVVWLRRFHR